MNVTAFSTALDAAYVAMSKPRVMRECLAQETIGDGIIDLFEDTDGATGVCIGYAGDSENQILTIRCKSQSAAEFLFVTLCECAKSIRLEGR
jgi:hypothetical protein